MVDAAIHPMNDRALVEAEDGEAVATVSMLLDDPEYWGVRPPDAVYVHKLAVRRDRAGRGIGAAIVEWANAEAAEAGREFLRLDCYGDNPGIRDYYEGLGFERTVAYATGLSCGSQKRQPRFSSFHSS